MAISSNHRPFRRILALLTLFAVLPLAFLTTACDQRQELVVYNWGEYIAEDTIAKFEKAYPQYKVVYRTFESNETMYPNLNNNYDVIIPSEYMVCRLIREEKIQKLDLSLLTNVTANMDPLFQNIQYDQDTATSELVLDYAVPYMYCTVGLVYDANKVSIPEDTSDPQVIWGVLFDAANQNKIGMYDLMRESMGVALNYYGSSLNTLDESKLTQAQQLLLDQKKIISPTYGVDNLKDKIAAGEPVAAASCPVDHVFTLERIEEP